MTPGAVKCQRGRQEQSAHPKNDEPMTWSECPHDGTEMESAAGGGGTCCTLDQTRDTG